MKTLTAIILALTLTTAQAQMKHDHKFSDLETIENRKPACEQSVYENTQQGQFKSEDFAVSSILRICYDKYMDYAPSQSYVRSLQIRDQVGWIVRRYSR